jgi:hypothetical protein
LRAVNAAQPELHVERHSGLVALPVQAVCHFLILAQGLSGEGPQLSERPKTGQKSQHFAAPLHEVLVPATFLKACAGNRLVDVRDGALLITAFASGGRRRSEIASLRIKQIIEEDSVPADPKEPGGEKLPCLSIRLGRTKTTQADSDAFVLLVGRPVTVLQSWLERAGITEGAVFRGIDRWAISKNAR